MTTKTDLENALKDSIRSGNEIRKRTIRMTIAAVRMVELDKKTPLDEQGIIAVIQKEVKSRQESIADAQRANRPDLIAESQAEIEILETFLPKQLNAEELEAMAKDAIREVCANAPGDMGKVMKLLTPRLQGRATGAQASQVVRQLLMG